MQWRYANSPRYHWCSLIIRPQRIYVHENVYDRFVSDFIKLAKASLTDIGNTHRALISLQTYKLGDPTSEDTNLGPVVSLASAERIRKQVADASEH